MADKNVFGRVQLWCSVDFEIATLIKEHCQNTGETSSVFLSKVVNDYVEKELKGVSKKASKKKKK